MGDRTTSRTIAHILGPALVVLGVSEALNFDIFAGNPAPVVYLDGAILFVAGLAIVQAHNRWAFDWTVLATLAGWLLLAGGLYRMFAPTAPQASKGPATDAIFAVLIAAGCVLSYGAYRPQRTAPQKPPPV